jgi:hypothetical protein
LFRKLHETYDGFGVYGCETVDYTGGIEVDNRPELLAKSRKDSKFLRVYDRIEGYLEVV